MANPLQCSSCHFEKRPGIQFCENCGQTLTVSPFAAAMVGEICLVCGYQNRSGVKFCENCGQKLPQSAKPVSEEPPTEPGPKTCPKCGVRLRAGTRFCENCGEELDASAKVKTTSAEPARAVAPVVSFAMLKSIEDLDEFISGALLEVLPCHQRYKNLLAFLIMLGGLQKSYCVAADAAMRRGDVDIFGTSQELFDAYTKSVWTFFDTQPLDRNSKQWFIFPTGGFRIKRKEVEEFGWEFDAVVLFDQFLEAGDTLRKWYLQLEPQVRNVIGVTGPQFIYYDQWQGLTKSICEQVDRYVAALGLSV